jgi:hypothetical protein
MSPSASRGSAELPAQCRFRASAREIQPRNQGKSPTAWVTSME